VVHRALDHHAEQVTQAVDGAGALRALHADRPDLVLLDLDIPAPDGAAVLAEMRGDPDLRTVPVIVLTSAALGLDQRAALGTTAALLGKSHFSIDLLLAAARAAARLVGGSA
jgi:CheY-like chemotaxis protein